MCGDVEIGGGEMSGGMVEWWCAGLAGVQRGPGPAHGSIEDRQREVDCGSLYHATPESSEESSAEHVLHDGSSVIIAITDFAAVHVARSPSYISLASSVYLAWGALVLANCTMQSTREPTKAGSIEVGRTASQPLAHGGMEAWRLVAIPLPRYERGKGR